MWAIVTMCGANSAYEQLNNGDDIFTGIHLPEDIDRATLVNRIMLRCGEFSVMHTDIDFMHFQILNFFEVHYRTFEKWVTALNIEYNPLENYDRYEEYEGSGTSESDTSTSGSGSGSDTLTKAATNSSSYEPYDKHTTSESSSSSGGTDVEYGDEHTSHIHGNIGVTTSQQMLQSELEIAKFNIYTTIADLFADEFCIMVY